MSRRLFWPQSDHPDFDVIEFHYRRVGTLEIKAARNDFTMMQAATGPIALLFERWMDLSQSPAAGSTFGDADRCELYGRQD